MLWISAPPPRKCSEGLDALGPRADLVVEQIHFEHLELRELRQGGGQALNAGRAWEALDAAQGVVHNRWKQSWFIRQRRESQ